MEGVWAVKMLSEVREAGLGQRKVWGRMKWEQQGPYRPFKSWGASY